MRAATASWCETAKTGFLFPAGDIDALTELRAGFLRSPELLDSARRKSVKRAGLFDMDRV